MSNDYPGDEPTRAYRRPSPQRSYDDQDATRLERPVQGWDENREPAYNPYPLGPDPDAKPGIVAQLVLVGLIGIIVGLVLGYFLFRGVGSGSNSDSPTTTVEVTSSTTATTAVTTTTTSEETTSSTRRSTTTTTTKPSTTTTTPRSTTSTSGATTTTG